VSLLPPNDVITGAGDAFGPATLPAPIVPTIGTALDPIGDMGFLFGDWGASVPAVSGDLGAELISAGVDFTKDELATSLRCASCSALGFG
jgi:hypothetical protein